MSRRRPVRRRPPPASRAEPSGPRVRRLPVLLLVVALLGGAWLVGDRVGEEAAAPSPTTTPVSDLAPLAPAEGAASATWFCAGGTASPGGAADSVLDIANESDEAAQGTVEVFPSPVAAGTAAPAPVPISIAPNGRIAFRLADVAVSDYSAALVETQGGSVVVQQEIRSDAGSHDIAPCASRASSTWYFPWGQTIVGSTMRLSLFNPFPGDAVVDVTFETEDGFRSPESFQGVLVPARRLVVLDVDSVVTRRQQVATQVVARTGRLVAANLQTVTAGDGTVDVDVAPGASAPAFTWYYADGRADASTLERFVVFNPGDQTAEVSVTLLTGVAASARAEPFELRLSPGAVSEVTLNNETRVALPIVHATLVQAEGDQPVVVERVLVTGGFLGSVPGAPAVASATPGTDTTSTTETPPTTAAPPAASGDTGALPELPPGVAATLGSPILASRWVVALPLPVDGTTTPVRVGVVNPSSTGPVDVQVDVIDPTGPRTVGGGQVQPGRRLDVDIEPGTAALVVVQASAPVVTGRVMVLRVPDGLSASPALAVAGTAEVPARFTR